MAAPLAARNRRIAVTAFCFAALMVGAAFAAVPLYRIFCQVTGYGGTPQVAETAPATMLERRMTVRFNADTGPALPWEFAPAQRKISIRVGEQALAFYRARNLSDRAVTGTATFNVTPLKAGQYFSKIDCFCFTEQTLAPGASADMPVTFFVDPAIADDPNLDDVTTITLSYTFFETEREPDDNRTAGAAGGPAARDS